MSSVGFSVAPMATLRPCRDVNTAFWANRPSSATTCIHKRNTMWRMLDEACVCVSEKECCSTANTPNDQCVCPTRTNVNVQGCCSWFMMMFYFFFRHIKGQQCTCFSLMFAQQLLFPPSAVWWEQRGCFQGILTGLALINSVRIIPVLLQRQFSL